MMSSLYIGETGMISLGQGMGVISNNLSNLNTVAFKERLALYQDVVSSYLPCPSYSLGDPQHATSFSQLGHGVRTSAVVTRFYENGGMEKSNKTTDLCINGKGFFQVSQNGKTYYTRAGNFNFDKEGTLLATSGATVMGSRISGGAPGGLGPIQITPADRTLAPKPTSQVTLISNLGLNTSATSDPTNPFFSLATSWSGLTNKSPQNAAFSNGFSVYDNMGNRHDIDVSYDKVNVDSGGRKIVQFTATIPPSEDARAGFVNTAGAGMVMSGVMYFTPAGALQGLSAYAPSSGANIANLATWNNVNVGAAGIPMSVSFNNMDQTGATSVTTASFNLDFGLGFAPQGGGAPPSAIGTNPNNIAGYTAAGNTAPAATSTNNRTVAFNGVTGTLFKNQDGYSTGYLNNINIGRTGNITLNYDNGQSADLYQIPLFRFNGEQDLKAEGHNLFSATIGSGPAQQGVADTENFGSITSRALEMSNVDMARQFSQMILTQRGFQYNSKVITTSDAMIQKALELKRA